MGFTVLRQAGDTNHSSSAGDDYCNRRATMIEKQYAKSNWLDNSIENFQYTTLYMGSVNQIDVKIELELRLDRLTICFPANFHILSYT